jgi:hypothetical protein
VSLDWSGFHTLRHNGQAVTMADERRIDWTHPWQMRWLQREHGSVWSSSNDS